MESVKIFRLVFGSLSKAVQHRGWSSPCAPGPCPPSCCTPKAGRARAVLKRGMSSRVSPGSGAPAARRDTGVAKGQTTQRCSAWHRWESSASERGAGAALSPEGVCDRNLADFYLSLFPWEKNDLWKGRFKWFCSQTHGALPGILQEPPFLWKRTAERVAAAPRKLFWDWESLRAGRGDSSTAILQVSEGFGKRAASTLPYKLPCSGNSCGRQAGLIPSTRGGAGGAGGAVL